MAKKPHDANSNNLPSNLSWMRSIDVSSGLLYSVIPGQDTETLSPVEVSSTTVRGASASFDAGIDKKKGNSPGEEILVSKNSSDKANIQRIDQAVLDHRSNKLSIQFSVGVHGASAHPYNCNDPIFTKKAEAFHTAAISNAIFTDLGQRYVWALANGGVFWRNGIGRNKRVEVVAEGFTCIFDSDALHARKGRGIYPGFDAVAAADMNGNAWQLADAWSAALEGKGFLELDVDARVQLFSGAEVWPSQEFINKDKDKDDSKDAPSRVLSSLMVKGNDGTPVRQATMHSQKLGNALRTVDEWHGSERHGALPVEAFGWIQDSSEAVRTVRNDAYTLLRDLDAITASIMEGDGVRHEDALYVAGILVRGGVYVMGGKEVTKEKSVDD